MISRRIYITARKIYLVAYSRQGIKIANVSYFLVNLKDLYASWTLEIENIELPYVFYIFAYTSNTI